MAVTRDKYDKIQLAMGFLSQNEDEARAEMGDEKFDAYMGQLRQRSSEFESLESSEGELGTRQELEAAKKLVAGKTGGFDSSGDEFRKTRDTMVSENAPAPKLEGGEPAALLPPPVAAKPKPPPPKKPKVVPAERQVAAAVEGAAGVPSAPEEPLQLPEEPGEEPVYTDSGALLLERKKSNELVAQRERELKDPSLPTASKVIALRAPPEHIGKDRKSGGWWLEPSIEEFRADMANTYGPYDVQRLDENSQAYKEYADARWKQAYDSAVKNDRTIKRVNFSKEVSYPGGVRALGTVAAGMRGIDRGALLGLGSTVGELVQPGFREKASRIAERAPGGRGIETAGFALGAVQPYSLSSLTVRGIGRLGGAVAPGAAKFAARHPLLTGPVTGAAAGAIGAGAESAIPELSEMATGNRPATLEEAKGVGRRALGAAGYGAAAGGVAGGLLGGAAALRRSTRASNPDLRMVQEAGGDTAIIKGVRPPPAVKELRKRAAAYKPEAGAQAVTDEQLLSRELAEDVRKFGSGMTAQYNVAEEALVSNVERSAAKTGKEYAETLGSAEESMLTYAKGMTSDYEKVQRQMADELEEYIRNRSARLAQTEGELTREIADYGTEASQEFERNMGELVTAVGKGAREGIAKARETVARMNADYYKSPQGLERHPIKGVVDQWLGALRRGTDEFGAPTPGTEDVIPKLQDQARRLFDANSRTVAQTAEEVAAARQRLMLRTDTDTQVGDVRVLSYQDARRLGLVDPMAEVSDPSRVKVVIQERKLNARELDRYQQEFRDWSGIEAAQGRKYQDLEGVEPAIYKARQQFKPSSSMMADESILVPRIGGRAMRLKGWAATKYRESQLLQEAQNKAQAAGLPAGNVEGLLDFNTERAIRGRVEAARKGPSNPEMEKLFLDQSVQPKVAQLEATKARAADVGVQVPVPEELTEEALGRIRGKVREGIAGGTGAAPTLERVLERRGRLPQLREAQDIESEARRLGVTGAANEGPVRALDIVRGHSPDRPNMELLRISGKLPSGESIGVPALIERKMGALGLKPDFKDTPTREQLQSINSLLDSYSSGKLPAKTQQDLEDLFAWMWGAQGYRLRALKTGRESLAKLNLPPDFAGGLTPEQAKGLKTLVAKYSKGEIRRTGTSDLTERAWRGPGGPEALTSVREARQQLGGLGLEPNIGKELTPEQATQVGGLISKYGKGELLEPTAKRLESAIGPGAAAGRLRLLPPTLATKRLEGGAKARLPLTMTPSGFRVAAPLGGSGLRLRADALARYTSKGLRAGGVGAATQANKRQEPPKGGRLDAKTKADLLRIRRLLEGAPDARGPL